MALEPLYKWTAAAGDAYAPRATAYDAASYAASAAYRKIDFAALAEKATGYRPASR